MSKLELVPKMIKINKYKKELSNLVNKYLEENSRTARRKS